jgi:hypothetical protein
MGATGLMMMLVLLGGGGNDLLDFISPEAYWKAKGVEVTVENLLAELKPAGIVDTSALIKQLGASEYEAREEASRRLAAMGPAVLPELRKAARSSDPEIAGRAGKIIHGLSGKARERVVRRLMAIRTLGERKDRRAIPTLRKLLNSKAIFEAEYARAAIAAIEGKPFKRPGASARAMQSDLWLLPANCGAVGQVGMLPGKPIDIKQILKTLGPMLPEGKADKAMEQVNKMIISVADRVGNIRLDGITFGVAETVGNDTGNAVLVVRGLYDPAAVREVLMGQRAKSEKVGRTEVLRIDIMAVILASNDRLVFMVGASKEQLPVAQMVAALKSGKGKLAGDKAMAGLIKSVDTTNPVWAVARVSESYRQAEMLAPFKTVTLVGKRKAGQMDFTLKARGVDAEKVAVAVGQFNKLMAEGCEEMARVAEKMPAMKPITEFIGSIKAVVDGTNATLTARLKGDMKTLLGMPLMMFSHSSEAREVAVEAIKREQRKAPEEVPAPR